MTHHCMKTQRYNYKNGHTSLVCSQNGSCIAKQLFALDIHTKNCMSKSCIEAQVVFTSSPVPTKENKSRKQINFMMILIDYHAYNFIVMKWPQVLATTSLSRFHLVFFGLTAAVALLLSFLFLVSLLSGFFFSVVVSSSGTTMQSWSCGKTA